MRTYTKKELAEMLRKHKLWINGEDGGERADLSRADLCGAYLCGAYLRGADLSRADLRYADLSYANLCGANLRYADLCGADLRYADLRDADLSDANLRDADLHYANLSHADLNDTKNVIAPIACPETGAFIGWKKCFGGLIVELEICADAKRSSSTGRKCRCDKAKVLSIAAPDGSPLDCANSGYDWDFVYRVGETVSVDDFDDNRWNECAPGIHFFITRQEAVDY